MFSAAMYCQESALTITAAPLRHICANFDLERCGEMDGATHGTRAFGEVQPHAPLARR